MHKEGCFPRSFPTAFPAAFCTLVSPTRPFPTFLALFSSPFPTPLRTPFPQQRERDRGLRAHTVAPRTVAPQSRAAGAAHLVADHGDQRAAFHRNRHLQAEPRGRERAREEGGEAENGRDPSLPHRLDRYNLTMQRGWLVPVAVPAARSRLAEEVVEDGDGEGENDDGEEFSGAATTVTATAAAMATPAPCFGLGAFQDVFLTDAEMVCRARLCLGNHALLTPQEVHRCCCRILGSEPRQARCRAAHTSRDSRRRALRAAAPVAGPGAGPGRPRRGQRAPTDRPLCRELRMRVCGRCSRRHLSLPALTVVLAGEMGRLGDDGGRRGHGLCGRPAARWALDAATCRRCCEPRGRRQRLPAAAAVDGPRRTPHQGRPGRAIDGPAHAVRLLVSAAPRCVAGPCRCVSNLSRADPARWVRTQTWQRPRAWTTGAKRSPAPARSAWPRALPRPPRRRHRWCNHRLPAPHRALRSPPSWRRHAPCAARRHRRRWTPLRRHGTIDARAPQRCPRTAHTFVPVGPVYRRTREAVGDENQSPNLVPSWRAHLYVGWEGWCLPRCLRGPPLMQCVPATGNCLHTGGVSTQPRQRWIGSLRTHAPSTIKPSPTAWPGCAKTRRQRRRDGRRWFVAGDDYGEGACQQWSQVSLTNVLWTRCCPKQAKAEPSVDGEHTPASATECAICYANAVSHGTSQGPARRDHWSNRVRRMCDPPTGVPSPQCCDRAGIGCAQIASHRCARSAAAAARGTAVCWKARTP